MASEGLNWYDIPEEMRGEVLARMDRLPWGLATLFLLGQTNKFYYKKIIKDPKRIKKYAIVDMLASALASGSWTSFRYLVPPNKTWVNNVRKRHQALGADRRKLIVGAGHSGNLQFVAEVHKYIFDPLPEKMRGRRSVEETHMASTGGMFPYPSLRVPLIESIDIWEKKYAIKKSNYCRGEERLPLGIIIAMSGTGADADFAQERGYAMAQWAFEVACQSSNLSVVQWYFAKRTSIIFYNAHNMERSFKILMKSSIALPGLELVLLDDRSTPYLQNGLLCQLALENGQEPCLLRLIEDVRVPNDFIYRSSVLASACWKGMPRIVKKILEDPRVDPNITANSRTYIHWSLQSKNADVARAILTCPRYNSIENEVPTLIASLTTDLRATSIYLLLLKQKGFPVAYQNGYFLLLSIRNVHEELVAALLDHPDIPNPFAFVSADFSIFCQNPKLFRVLYERKHFFNRLDSNHIHGGLMSACQRNNAEIVKILVADRRCDSLPLTSFDYDLTMACQCGYVEVVKALLTHRISQGNSVAVSLSQGLIGAAQGGYVEIVDILLNHKLTDPSHSHNQALRMASANNYVGIVKSLLKDPRLKPKANSLMVLQGIVERHAPEVLKLLLSDGRFDPNQDDGEMFKRAVSRNNWWVVQAMEPYMSKEILEATKK